MDSDTSAAMRDFNMAKVQLLRQLGVGLVLQRQLQLNQGSINDIVEAAVRLVQAAELIK